MEYMESKMQDVIEGGINERESLYMELDRRKDLLAWAYSKLAHGSFARIDDALKLDEIKLLLEHDI